MLNEDCNWCQDMELDLGPAIEARRRISWVLITDNAPPGSPSILPGFLCDDALVSTGVAIFIQEANGWMQWTSAYRLGVYAGQYGGLPLYTTNIDGITASSVVNEDSVVSVEDDFWPIFDLQFERTVTSTPVPLSYGLTVTNIGGGIARVTVDRGPVLTIVSGLEFDDGPVDVYYPVQIIFSDPLTVDDSGGGVALINIHDADYEQRGCVNDQVQHWIGDKYFY